jgi:molybdopterin-binding protein
MKLSARNQYPGTVIDIQEGIVNAKVVVDIGGGKTMTSTISMEALKDLGLEIGSETTAIVKAPFVILGV